MKTVLRTGLMDDLPNGTELSAAPVATFFEGDAETIIARASDSERRAESVDR